MTIFKLSRLALGTALAVVSCSLFAAEITLYAQPDFHGQRMTIHGAAPNLERADFNDRASSIIVRDGAWEACTDAYFRGRCQTLEPGEYPDLSGALNDRISSVREVAGGYEPRYAPRAEGYGRHTPSPSAGGYGSEPRAILYEGEGFGGRSFEIDRNAVRNLDPSGFNDRAGSLRVLEGRWVFCSDAEFQGDCRTFEPGDYARLPGSLDHRISSGHRVGER